MYDLKTNEHGMVKVTKKAGSAYVVTHLPEGMCRGLIANAETVKSSNRWEGMGIVINGDEIYFEGTYTEEKPATEDKKPEKKDFHNNSHGKKKH
ncbi:MAG: hypothetical protein IKH75_11475 [Ruminococcus sp.]|nr:hypothetical protein [Ruminococcus sp.]